MSLSPKVDGAVKWYAEKRSLYESLANKVESILREVLDGRRIIYHSVASRAKSLSRYKEKASQERYTDPKTEIMDMAGVRVITYTQSDANHVADIVREVFETSPQHSIDKTKELGIDRVGYRSIHFVATLGATRLRLPENSIFTGLCFEIQVRTILQHAWAEFEHDRNYKFAGVLPVDLQRRVLIIAGSLELIEREFDNIGNEIEKYSTSIADKTDSGDLTIPIDSTSLKAYLDKKFASLVKATVQPTFNRGDQIIINELSDMGITTLQNLDQSIPQNYQQNYPEIRSKFPVPYDNYLRLLRNIMIIKNADLYFSKAWKHNWRNAEANYAEQFKAFGVDLRKYAKQYGFNIIEAPTVKSDEMKSKPQS
ncbi:MAG TPA: hypothetical protein VJZ75_10330 [Candidatus Bathyarchaeia archaeon]|nr:hypothetical protein [Candidatus Bathyarchaeia archaeon]